MRNCLIFLLDESSDMRDPVARATAAAPAVLASAGKSKSESVATAVNSLLAKLQHIPDLDIGLVGYREDADGAINVAPRWPASLAGKDLICSSSLGGNEELIEKRPRRVPLPDGSFDQKVIEFPVWYVPSLGNGSPQAAAFQRCCSMLDTWAREQDEAAGQAVIIHAMGKLPESSDSVELRHELNGLAATSVKPTVMHVQLGSYDNVPATLLPANRASVTQGVSRDMFDLAGVLPDAIVDAVRRRGVNAQPAARSLAFNARMIDLRKICDAVIETLNPSSAAEQKASDADEQNTPVLPARTQSNVESTLSGDAGAPSVEEQTEHEGNGDRAPSSTVLFVEPDTEIPVSAESPCLVVFVLDRSVDSSNGTGLSNVLSELSESLADTIGWLAKVGLGAVDIAIVAYGALENGTPIVDVVQTGGNQFVRDTQLESIAIRTEDRTQELPNGVGGLISIPRTLLYLADFQPASPGSVAPAMTKAREIVDAWSSQQSSAHFPVTVVHLTRGKAEPADLSVGAETIGESHHAVLYNFILTDSEHVTVILPENSDQVNDNLQAYWDCASPLLLREQLAANGKKVRACSRGLVINGDLPDLLQPVKWKLSQSE